MYFVKNGKLIYQNDQVLLYIEKPAFMYDVKANLLLKHGEYEQVQEYYRTFVKGMLAVEGVFSAPSIAEDVSLVALAVSPKIAADFLNEAISCTGAIKEQIDRILGGLE